MTNAQQIDESLLNDDIRAIIKRTKRTDEEKALIASLKAKTLSETAKTYVKECVKRELYGFREQVESKYLDKGKLCEDDAIGVVGEATDRFYVKHVGRMENQWLTGEPDILEPDYGRDTKCSWSIKTHPFFDQEAQDDVKDAGYDWQMRAYMMLYDRPKWFVDYVLLPTPVDCLKWGDDPVMLIDAVERVPLKHRVKSVEIVRDMAIEKLMIEKLTMAQQYAKTLIEQLS